MDASVVDATPPPMPLQETVSCKASTTVTGSLTNYTKATPVPACAEPWPSDGMYLAINTALFDEGYAASACNKCVSVTGTTGQTVTLVVVDECPAGTNKQWCQSNHLDINSGAYGKVEPGQNGAINGGVPWKYVPCSWTDGIHLLFQTGSGMYYLAVSAYHTTYGIQTIKYRKNGVWTDMTARSDDTAKEIVQGSFTINNSTLVPNPIDIAVVDEYGHVVEEDGLSWHAGMDFQSKQQFPKCQ